MRRGHEAHMKRRGTTRTIDEAEWNFLSRTLIPDSEVAACFLYEFAREFAKDSTRWKELTGQLAQEQGMPRGDPRRRGLLRVYRAIGALLGPASHVVLSSPRCQDHFLSTPWAKLDTASRRQVVMDLEEGLARPVNLVECVCLLVTLERDLPEWRPAGVEDFTAWKTLDHCFHWGRVDERQREYGFFAIDWNYTDAQLKEEFSKFLREKREDRRAAESRQGKNKMRHHLCALGAKRLLDAGLTAEAAMDYTGAVNADSKGDFRPLYGAPRTWYVAKRRVERLIGGLFTATPQTPS